MMTFGVSTTAALRGAAIRAGRILFALAALAAATACSATKSLTAAAPAASAQTAEAAAPATREPYEYLLGPGDRVRVSVFGEPNLSGDFQLDAAGSISMPLVGEIAASGIDSRRLESVVADALTGRFLVNPQVSVQVMTFRPYFVYGEVRQPGQFDFSSDLTVVNAIARAGGFTPRARQSAVFIRRENAAVEERYELTPDLKVYPGDTLRIGARFF